MFLLQTKKPAGAGFTLAEMAVVVLLIGIVMTLGLKMTTATLDNGAIAETKTKQDLIKLALLAYLRTNGTLPCPDITAVPTAPTGVAAAVCNTAASNVYGAVPWMTLNLPRDTVQDGWKNFFAYKVANGVGGTKDWTIKTAGLNTFTVGELQAPSPGLKILEGDGVTAPAQIVSTAVVSLLSFGKNGYGARTVQGQLAAASPAANASEVANQTNVAGAANAMQFIRRPYSENALAAGGGPFDDVLAYMTPQDLLQPLVNEKLIIASTPVAYKTAAIQALVAGFTACVPPATPALAAPALAPIAPSVGAPITYVCPAGYRCNTGTAIHPGDTQLYQLAVFNAAAVDISYAQVMAAVPYISTLCP